MPVPENFTVKRGNNLFYYFLHLRTSFVEILTGILFF